jgi:hypothetical protein
VLGTRMHRVEDARQISRRRTACATGGVVIIAA